jgi:hypothetical protein
MYDSLINVWVLIYAAWLRRNPVFEKASSTSSSSGPMNEALADPVEFAWTRLRPGIRMRPLGPVFTRA